MKATPAVKVKIAEPIHGCNAIAPLLLVPDEPAGMVPVALLGAKPLLGYFVAVPLAESGLITAS